MVSRNRKYEENMGFSFIYFTVVPTDVGYVSNIDIQREIISFGREQTGRNAPNIWFPGIENMRRSLGKIHQTYGFQEKEK
jgi:hypothetical protein